MYHTDLLFLQRDKRAASKGQRMTAALASSFLSPFIMVGTTHPVKHSSLLNFCHNLYTFYTCVLTMGDFISLDTFVLTLGDFTSLVTCVMTQCDFITVDTCLQTFYDFVSQFLPDPGAPSAESEVKWKQLLSIDFCV